MKLLSITISFILITFPLFSEDGHEGHSHDLQSKERGFNPDEEKKVTYTCPMHPNIKTHGPDSCPICGMDLVPIETENTSNEPDENSIMISNTNRRLAGIETEKVQSNFAYQNIKAVGSISFDEGRISTISAYVDGRIEKMYANYTGVEVKKGEHLAELYSPNLYSAQVEFLQAGEALLKMRNSNSSVKKTQKQLLKGAENKLTELGMTSSQIKKLKISKTPKSRLTLNSQVTGTVIKKNKVQGSYIKTGEIIYEVADLSTVWLLLDLFPEETAYLKFGLKVKANIRSAPDKDFIGRISFINPIINQRTRTVRVRVEIPNPDGILKPGDYADANIEVPLGSSGSGSKTFDPELSGKYISPMHPQIVSDKPGKCPICGMKLVPASQFGFTDNPSEIRKIITVPRNAVLTIGKNSAIFVETKENYFSLREVTTGQITKNNKVVILKGLKEGETIASSGVFLIDSQMQLSGKTSIMEVSTQKKAPKQMKHDHH